MKIRILNVGDRSYFRDLPIGAVFFKSKVGRTFAVANKEIFQLIFRAGVGPATLNICSGLVSEDLIDPAETVIPITRCTFSSG